MAWSSNGRLGNATQGVLLIVAAVFLMAFGDALVKAASADLTIWQIYALRALFACPILIALITKQGDRARLIPKSMAWTGLRSMLLVAMWIAYYGALPVLSLSVAAVALYTAPLFIALFSALLAGEPVGRVRWIAVVIGFGGVLAILRPAPGNVSSGVLLPVLGAVFYALAMIITRRKCAGEHPLALALALNAALLLTGLAASACLAVLDLTPEAIAAYPFLLGAWQPVAIRELVMLLLLALLIVAYSTCVAKAYQAAPSSLVATFDYTYLIFAAFWGFVLFAEVPDGGTVLGMLAIAAAGALAVRKPSPRRV